MWNVKLHRKFTIVFIICKMLARIWDLILKLFGKSHVALTAESKTCTENVILWRCGDMGVVTRKGTQERLCNGHNLFFLIILSKLCGTFFYDNSFYFINSNSLVLHFFRVSTHKKEKTMVCFIKYSFVVKWAEKFIRSSRLIYNEDENVCAATNEKGKLWKI